SFSRDWSSDVCSSDLRVTGRDVLLLVAALVLIPPLVLWTLGAAVGLVGRRARRAAHAASVGMLVVLFAIQLGRHLSAVRGPLLRSEERRVGNGTGYSS